MIAYNCPLGKLICDGCNNLTTGGCLAKQHQSQALSITRDDVILLWEMRREELMKLPKEALVELIIGKKEHIGITIG